MEPASTEALARAHDSDMWTCVGLLSGHCTVQQTLARLQPLQPTASEWPREGTDWLRGVLASRGGENGGERWTEEAAWSQRWSQQRRADGGMGWGCANDKRDAAYVGSWALAIREGMLSDFPQVGTEVGRDAAARVRSVAGLAASWERMVALLEDSEYLESCPGQDAPHDDHRSLHCFCALAANASPVMARPRNPGGEPTVLPHFADHLQKRLMAVVHAQHARSILDAAAQAEQNAPTVEGRRLAQWRWDRMAATAGPKAHAVWTALPEAPGEVGWLTLDSRTVHILMCARMGIPAPRLPGFDTPLMCPLHPYQQEFQRVVDMDDHMCHCGRRTAHIMHTGMEVGLAQVACSVPGLGVKTEVAVFAGSGCRMDVVLTCPEAEVTTMFVDVTMGTAMGYPRYAGTPRVGARHARGLGGAAAAEAEAAKDAKYASRTADAGPAHFEGFCIEDLGAWGLGAERVLQFLADAAYGHDLPAGHPAVQAKRRFKWLAAQHVAVQAARGLALAHDTNLRSVHDVGDAHLDRLGRLDLYTDTLALELGPRGREAALQAPPSH